MNKKVKWMSVLCVCLSIVVMYGGYLYFTTPRIQLKENVVSLELHTKEYDPLSYIEGVTNGSLKDVHIQKNTVDTEVLGTYVITYELHQVRNSLRVQVVDTKAPEVLVEDVTIEVGDTLTTEQCYKEIIEETPYEVSLKEAYTFDTIGDVPVSILVQDASGNTTEASFVVHVIEKDTTAPSITASDIQVYVNDSFDALSYASAMDERDGAVSVEVEDNQVDMSKPGDYIVTFRATDRHQNTSTKQIVVHVLPKGTTPSGKVIYLTIDDGPSANTPAVLDILDRYHVKATFFVSGQCPSYASYIGLAYQKGHAIGLHTNSHNYASVYANDASYFQDLQAISDIVYQQTGIRSNIIRFPGGSSNAVSKNYNIGIMTRLSSAVRQKGYQYFDWNASSGDGNSATPAASLLANAKSYGGKTPLMMLLHDHSGSATSVEALPGIIEYYQSLGYQFLTVDASTNGFHHGINN